MGELAVASNKPVYIVSTLGDFHSLSRTRRMIQAVGARVEHCVLFQRLLAFLPI